MAQRRASVLGWRRRARATARSLLLILLLGGPPVSAAGVLVQNVDVRLAVEGVAPPAAVRARLQETLETVAQRLLQNRPVDQLRPNQAQLQSTLTTVVDRVIAGYVVAEARVDVGPTAVVMVRLRPNPPVIQTLEVAPRTRVDPIIAPLVFRSVEQDVTPVVRSMFTGLPLAALEWAAPLLDEQIRRAVELALPGFTAVARIHPGTSSRVEIDIAPRDTRVVRDIGVRFRSGSIPLILLEPHGPAVLSMAEPIRGLPVAFVERHRDLLERLVADRLRTYPPALEYDVIARPLLIVAETAYITVVADSMVWLARVEAAVNVGVRAPAPEVRLHLGRLAGRFEVFAEAALAPNTLSARYELGTRYRLTPEWDLGVSVTVNEPATTGWLVYRFTPDLSVRAAYGLETRRIEGGVRLRFNEFLSGELVGTSSGDYWLRLISNL